MSARRIYVAMMVFAVMLADVGISQADQAFTPRSIRGTWGFSVAGTLRGAPAVTVGLVTFDGVGECVPSAQLNVGGTVTALTSLQCSYTVNPDGTGAVNVTFVGPVGPFIVDFVIVDAKKEILIIISDRFGGGGTVASGVAKRQEPGDR